MAIALANNLGNATGTSLTSLILTVGATTTVGNTIILGVVNHAQNATVSATDSAGNTYQLDKSQAPGSNAEVSILSSKTIASLASGTGTITVSFSVTVNNVAVFAYEYSGLKATTYVDVVAGAGGTSTSPNSGNLVTTSAVDLLFGVVGWEKSNPSTATSWTKLDELDNYLSSTKSALTEASIVSSTGTYAATATITSAGWTAAAAAYKGATGSAPVNTVAPAISGTQHVGQTLTTTNGTWTDDGSPTFSYQWQNSPDGTTWTAISGATSSTYVLANSDDGLFVRSQVTDSDSNGNGAAQSSATSKVTFAAPTNTVAPIATGTPTVGSVLSCDTGVWTT